MELCMNLEYLSKDIGLSEAVKAVKNAGFRLLDYTPDVSRDWRADIYEVLDCIESNGLQVYQSHAPFNRYLKASAEEHRRLVDESLSAAVLLGAKYLVVHGDEFDFSNLTYSPQTALDYNYDYFAPIVEKAEKYGVGIAFENVFEENQTAPRNCSKAEDLIALIDRFHCSCVCCCWDFGHGAVAYKEKQDEVIRLMGNRIRCTHVHDNYLYADMHLIPFFGKIDWRTCMNALKEGGMPEVLSFELVYGCVPLSAALPAMQLLYCLGEQLISF